MTPLDQDDAIIDARNSHLRRSHAVQLRAVVAEFFYAGFPAQRDRGMTRHVNYGISSAIWIGWYRVTAS
ncbi:MAG TPA: hypothetical protein VJ577_08540 [Burkholderiaceae bacterium]|nr:hypothetical protein [Burkholderiaceae bacterium]